MHGAKTMPKRKGCQMPKTDCQADFLTDFLCEFGLLGLLVSIREICFIFSTALVNTFAEYPFPLALATFPSLKATERVRDDLALSQASITLAKEVQGTVAEPAA